MFYYYGRKKKIAKYYPTPQFSTIIEPFAGSAAYSMHGDNWKNDVLIMDKDERICDIWDWLIRTATVDDIISLPDLVAGQKTSDVLHIVQSVSKRWHQYKTMTVTDVMVANWNASRAYMSKNLYKIKHWRLECGDYASAPDIEATWFIDPPYKGDAGTGYAHGIGDIDYSELAEWILGRKGQVIACEGLNGDYLPFGSLIEQVGVAGKMNKEYVFIQDTAAYF